MIAFVVISLIAFPVIAADMVMFGVARFLSICHTNGKAG